MGVQLCCRSKLRIMIKLIVLTTLALSTPSNAEPDPNYYYGGPGYYHGYYSPGFKQYPSYYHNQVDTSNLYTFTGPATTGATESRGKRSVQGDRTYVSLLNPYRDITHYGYPHYYAYGHPIHLNYAGGNRRYTGRQKRQIFRNLEIPSDSQSADLTDEELNRILRLLINNRKAEPVAEELRRIGGGRRSYGRGSSGKTEGQTVSYLGYITLGIIP